MGKTYIGADSCVSQTLFFRTRLNSLQDRIEKFFFHYHVSKRHHFVPERLYLGIYGNTLIIDGLGVVRRPRGTFIVSARCFKKTVSNDARHFVASERTILIFDKQREDIERTGVTQLVRMTSSYMKELIVLNCIMAKFVVQGI